MLLADNSFHLIIFVQISANHPALLNKIFFSTSSKLLPHYHFLTILNLTVKGEEVRKRRKKTEAKMSQERSKFYVQCTNMHVCACLPEHICMFVYVRMY